MVTFKEYIKNTIQNNIELMPKEEWTALNNELIKNKIYFKIKDDIDNKKIDNMLYKIKTGKEL